MPLALRLTWAELAELSQRLIFVAKLFVSPLPISSRRECPQLDFAQQ